MIKIKTITDDSIGFAKEFEAFINNNEIVKTDFAISNVGFHVAFIQYKEVKKDGTKTRTKRISATTNKRNKGI